MEQQETNVFLRVLIQDTLNRQLKWESTSSPIMFMVKVNGIVYSIEQVKGMALDYNYVFSEWDTNGNVIEECRPKIDSETYFELKRLFSIVVDSEPLFSEKYSDYSLSQINADNPPESISLFKIKKRLGLDMEGANEYVGIRENQSFYYVTEAYSNYVEPPFVQLVTYKGLIPISKAEVLLISAPGATGKSALSSYLSNKMNIPLFDLGVHPAVGAHSLVGLLVDHLSTDDYVKFKDGLSQGKFSMIIDGLDEAEIKASSSAYESFLDDVVKIAKGAKGVPFLMLGRSRVVEDTMYYLEKNDVRVSCLQIEPFTLKQACEFIDKTMSERNSANRFEKSYHEVRNYIIDSIGGFFKNEGELRKESFNRFIGYAPVLMSIASLLSERQDYNKLLNELRSGGNTSMELVLEIIEKILIREKEKVRNQVLPPLIQEYKVEGIDALAASIEEQCARVLCYVQREPCEFSLTGEPDFDHKYNKKMDDWVSNHPFVKANYEIQNIVFESYIIAKLSTMEKYLPLVIKYLKRIKSNSYLLFDFYDRLVNETRYVHYQMLPYLFDSFRALDQFNGSGAMELISTTEDDEFLEASCELAFYRQEQDAEIDFVTNIPYDEQLFMPSSLYGIMVDVPLKVSCDAPRLDMRPPFRIRCKEMYITSRDVVITNTNATAQMTIECDLFQALQVDGNIPSLIDRSEGSSLVISTSSEVKYPFSNYRNPIDNNTLDDRVLLEKYRKLCKTIILFRSNGKENMARIQDKIHSRICNTPVGKAVIKKLLTSRIIKSEGVLYVLNLEELDKQLGMSYNGIHSGTMNEKTRVFLMSITV